MTSLLFLRHVNLPIHSYSRISCILRTQHPGPTTLNEEKAEPLITAPRVQPRIIAAPKHGQLYWCDFWRDAQLPEMWKTRPVMILSYKNALYGPCLVVPLSTVPQGDSPWAWALSGTIDGRRTWVVCNHLYRIAPSRLSQIKGKIPRVPDIEFNEIVKRVMAWLPRPFEIDK